MSDRFSGECVTPPVWGFCDFCGRDINEGDQYRKHDDKNICGVCEKKYAYSLFLEESSVCTAQKEGWI